MEPMWHPSWEPFWQAVDQVQLPLHFHTFPTTPPRARQEADREFGEFADPAVDFDHPAMLLGNNLIGDRKTEPGAFPGRLGGDKGLEQFVPDLGCDAGAV